MLFVTGKRLLYGLFVLVGVSFLSFSLIFLTGDPAAALLPLGTPAEQIEAFSRQMGFDRPILVQFGDFLWRALHGDLGVSVRHREEALSLVTERLPATLTLAGTGLLFAVAIGLPLGIRAAVRPQSFSARFANTVALFGQTVPGFWLGIVLMLVFGVYRGWLPISGSGSWHHVILPGIVIAAGPAASLIRLVRAGMENALASDYVRTARAKGLDEATVTLKHGFKNVLIPIITMFGLEFGALMGGTVVAEVVFAYPGMGQLAMQAVTNRDVPVIQAFVFVTGAFIVVTNIVLDICYTLLDARVRYE